MSNVIFDRERLVKVLAEIATVIEGQTFCEKYSDNFYHSPSMYYGEVNVSYENGTDRENFKLSVAKSAFWRASCGNLLGNVNLLDKNYKSNSFVEPSGFKDMSYLTDFMNYVESYCSAKGLKKITDEELQQLKNQFLVWKLEERKNYYEQSLKEAKKKLINSERY